MLLPDYSYSSSFQSIYLVAIGVLEGRECSNVAGLQLVGRMRRQTTENDIVSETMLQDLEGNMRPKTVTQ